MPKDKPRADQLELSTFGPGVGECIVCHIGGGKWIVVDSCLVPGTDRVPAALHYFSEIGVNCAVDVQMLVVTHWHDDHFRGIYRVLDACPSAKFVMSNALRTEEFRQLFARASTFPSDRVTSGVDELNSVFAALALRSTQRGSGSTALEFASARKRLLVSPVIPAIGGVAAVSTEVWALSPSDACVVRAMSAIGEALRSDVGMQRRIAPITPNHAALVVWIQAGSTLALLGADLENTPDEGTGWRAIVGDAARPLGAACGVKVPHHGSLNAYHKQMWDSMVIRGACAVVTPFRRLRQPIPTVAMRERLMRDHGVELYCTADVDSPRRIQRRGVVERAIRDVVKSSHAINAKHGHVRMRKSIVDPNAKWEVQCFDDARRCG